MTTPTANFTPVRRTISDVTNAANAVVTTSEDHGYLTDDWIRIIVPDSHGMSIDYEPSKITVLSTTQFETTIDTSYRLAFAVPSAPYTDAQAVPFGGVTPTNVIRSDGT